MMPEPLTIAKVERAIRLVRTRLRRTVRHRQAWLADGGAAHPTLDEALAPLRADHPAPFSTLEAQATMHYARGWLRYLSGPVQGGPTQRARMKVLAGRLTADVADFVAAMSDFDFTPMTLGERVAQSPWSMEQMAEWWRVVHPSDEALDHRGPNPLDQLLEEVTRVVALLDDTEAER